MPIISKKTSGHKKNNNCSICGKEFDLGDIVVDCENDHVFHNHCFEEKAENAHKCPVCSCPMLFEEPFEEGLIQEPVNSSLNNVSPGAKRNSHVVIADLPTEPGSKPQNQLIFP